MYVLRRKSSKGMETPAGKCEEQMNQGRWENGLGTGKRAQRMGSHFTSHLSHRGGNSFNKQWGEEPRERQSKENQGQGTPTLLLLRTHSPLTICWALEASKGYQSWGGEAGEGGQ
jgi:hypothetical protein